MVTRLNRANCRSGVDLTHQRPIIINGAGGFAFSDGHSEIHKWLVPGTMVPVIPGGPIPTASLGSPQNGTDRMWLCGHACIMR